MSKKTKSKGIIRYKIDFKEKLVKLHLEEGYSFSFLHDEFGVAVVTLRRWAKRYKAEGVDGLKNHPNNPPGKKKKTTLAKNPHVREKIVELKKKYPIFGIQRITDLLKRVFFIKTSTETVRKTLHEENLIEKKRRKPKKNPQKPRRFERSTPNQMWQSDIFCFRLGGRNAYLLGFIDDYSRYIVGLGLYRSQTAENLIETYRQAIGEYGVPAEMLTDNGRQYTNWRGTTRFEKELKKERIKHIKSQPHHPMTLGKIERFWKTIWDEFLDRCQFDSLETARERIALWVKYYNCRRPHQGIKGLCPADRYFEVATKLRSVIESGIEENILEEALRGKPQKPFYMVGRMNDQTVVLRSEKGKFQVSVDGDECLNGKTGQENEVQRVEDKIEQGGINGQNEEVDYATASSESGKGSEDTETQNNEEESEKNIQHTTEMHSGTGVVERKLLCGNMPGDECDLRDVGKVAEQSYGGNDRSVDSEQRAEPTQRFSETEVAAALEQVFGENWREVEEAFAQGIAGDSSENNNRSVEDAASRFIGRETDERDHEGEKRIDDGGTGVGRAQCEPNDLLQMGGEGTAGDVRSSDQQRSGTPMRCTRSGERKTERRDQDSKAGDSFPATGS